MTRTKKPPTLAQDPIKITMSMLVELRLPTLPNFIRTENGDLIPIAQLSENELRHLGAQWTEALVNLAAKRRADKKASRHE